jgi:hypothetical protein
MGYCLGSYPVCENVLFLAFLYLLFRYCCAISREKRKRKISKKKNKDLRLPLVDYFDLG